MNDTELELKLTQNLKRLLSDNGDEIDIRKSADIFFKLGQIYKRKSPDKISLIKSVGLCNAALARKPNNSEIVQKELYELCQHILEQANAKSNTADLVEKAKVVKKDITLFREEIKKLVEEVAVIPEQFENEEELCELEKKKISSIENIQQKIASGYTRIMSGVSGYCAAVIGKPPCKFAVVGMGSLARKEATPYSDFEHMILLKKDKGSDENLEYFRWYSVIFHVLILNLQETIVPGLNIESLLDEKHNCWFYDAVTSRGISFDGMMPHACKFPLGKPPTRKKPWKTELIKSADAMLEYLGSEANLKNGYHLSDILTKSCFVYGDEDVYSVFTEGVHDYQNSIPEEEKLEIITHQVEEDLDKFTTRGNLTMLNSNEEFNMKKVFYRSTTLFVTALSQFYNIQTSSSFDSIRKLRTSSKISSFEAHKLMYAVALACELRLKVYLDNKSQRDTLKAPRKELGEKGDFIRYIGPMSTVSYFQIAYCFQALLADLLKVETHSFYSDPSLINILIYISLGLNWFTLTLEYRKNEFQLRNDAFHFENTFKFLRQKIQDDKSNNSPMSEILRSEWERSHSSNNEISQLMSFVPLLTKAGLVTEMLDFISQGSYVAKSVYPFYQYSIEEIKGSALSGMHHYNRSLSHFERATELLGNCPPPLRFTLLQNKGTCLLQLHRYEEALPVLQTALADVVQQLLGKCSSIYVEIMNSIGFCLYSLHEFEKAKSYFQESINSFLSPMFQHLVKDVCAAEVYTNMASCQSELGNLNDAKNSFDRAMELAKAKSIDEARDEVIANIYMRMGTCFLRQQQYEASWNYFKKAQKILEFTTSFPQTNHSSAVLNTNFGVCLLNWGRVKDAQHYLEKALMIYTKASDGAADRRVALAQRNLAECLLRLQSHKKALALYRNSFDIYQKLSSNEEKDLNVFFVLVNSGKCYFWLGKYAFSLSYFEKSLNIYKNLPSNQKSKRGDVDVYYWIGCCFLKLFKFNEALGYYFKASQILRNEPHKQWNLHINTNIEACLRQKQIHEASSAK